MNLQVRKPIETNAKILEFIKGSWIKVVAPRLLKPMP